MRHRTPLLVSLLALAPCALPQEQGPKPPNVVLIVVDDPGYADFSFQGDRGFATPNIDSLAEGGVRFTAAYATASVCSPSRAALLTGRYQQRFGHEFNLPHRYSTKDGLPAEERTLADALSAQGYATIAVGKWHLGYTSDFHPQQRGFDEFFGFLQGARSYFPLPPELRNRMNRLQRDGQPVQEDFSYLTDLLGEQAARAVEGQRAEPFFLYLSFSAVHPPMQADPALLEAAEGEGERRTLAAMTASLDRALGRVLDALERNGLVQDTLVVLVGDNGGGEANAADNGRLRGGKGAPYEGGIRVPMLVRWPRRFPAGLEIGAPVSLLDVFPTALAAARGELPGGLDGVDLAPFVVGEREGAPHAALFWRRGSDWAVRRGGWKLVGRDGAAGELYDLARDAGETTDLAARHPERAADLAAAHAAWAEGLVEPRWRSWVGEEHGPGGDNGGDDGDDDGEDV